jgi:hypothetical protein
MSSVLSSRDAEARKSATMCLSLARTSFYVDAVGAVREIELLDEGRQDGISALVVPGEGVPSGRVPDDLIVEHGPRESRSPSVKAS